MQKKTNKQKNQKNGLIVITLPFAIFVKIIIIMPEIYFWMLQGENKTERCDRI